MSIEEILKELKEIYEEFKHSYDNEIQEIKPLIRKLEKQTKPINYTDEYGQPIHVRIGQEILKDQLKRTNEKN